MKISENPISHVHNKKFFCPFTVTRAYINLWGPYHEDSDQFFIFRDQSLVTPGHLRETLSKMLAQAGLDKKVYSFHSLRAGCCTELIKLGYPIKTVKLIGRWKSNVVYKYVLLHLRMQNQRRKTKSAAQFQHMP